MSRRKILPAQVDFTGGQIAAEARRRDDLPLLRTGGRIMQNLRPRAIGTVRQRPGRRALFIATGPRVDAVRMTPSAEYKLVFSTGRVDITDSTGIVVASRANAAYLWTNETVSLISWTVVDYEITVCYPGMRPQKLIWNSATETWGFAAFAFTVRNGNVMAPFVRVSAIGATMTPADFTGAVSLVCSADFFTSAMIGETLSLLGRQVRIDAVTDPRTATVTIAKRLPDCVQFELVKSAAFEVGEVAESVTTKLKIEVGEVVDGVSVSGTLMSTLEWGGTTVADTLVSDDGSAATTVINAVTPPLPILQWSEEFMNDRVGWPGKCFSINGRLGFCDFPQRPDAVLFSALSDQSTFWIDGGAAGFTSAAGASATSAILEYAPRKVRVKHCVGFGDVIVFTDGGVFQIPISVQNPLKPGSVEFRQINRDACSDIQPVAGQDAILYVNAGLSRVTAILATGAASRSYSSGDVTEHCDLIVNPRALALASGDAKHPERMIYLVRGDGSVIAGRFVTSGDRFGVGWYPWPSEGLVSWVTLATNDVLFTTGYGDNYVVEVQDDDALVDGAISVNSPPEAMGGVGYGPLWWLAGGTVTVLDGARDLGDRAVDDLGYIVAQDGETLDGAGIVAGKRWTVQFDPFVPGVQGGQDNNQRQTMRRITRFSAVMKVANGARVQTTQIPAYGHADNAEGQPPVIDGKWSAPGPERSSDDPRVSVVKDRPGLVEIMEVSMRVSI
jgi:hypothetical protein